MSTAMQEWPRRHRITVDQYYRMDEVGLFHPDERVELIDGEIVDMAPIGIAHASLQEQLGTLLLQALGPRAIVRQGLPVHLGDRSEPQPDIAVVAPRADRYRTRHPVAADVLLLVEISDSTLRFDRDVKVSLYARHGVAEVWVLDVQNSVVLGYREPSGGAYAVSTTDALGLRPLAALPEVTVDLAPLA